MATKFVAISGGPVAVGTFGQYQTFLSIVQNLPSSTANCLISSAKEYKCEKEILWYNAIFFGFCIYILLLLFILPISSYLSKELLGDDSLNLIVVFAVILYPLFHVFSVSNAINTSQEDFSRYFKLNIPVSICYVLIFFIDCYFFGLGNVYFWVTLYVPISALVVFINTFFYYKNFKFSLNYLNVEALKKFSVFFMGGVISIIVTPVTIIFIRGVISTELGDIAMGNWQAMWRISEVYTSVILLCVSTIILPKIANASKANIPSVMLGAIKVVYLLFFSASFTIYFNLNYVTSLLYSSDFVIDSGTFVFQLLGDFFKVNNWILTYYFMSKSKIRMLASIELMTNFLFFCLCYFLVERSGLIVVSYSYSFVQFFCFIILVSKYYKVYNGDK